MTPVLSNLDEYVDAFEDARRARPDVELDPFLPPADDALYLPVLRELIRIDLEYGWESNRPRSLDDYRTSFPSLFADPESLQDVAFEDYRLRQLAGQAPSPEDYARRYGVRTDGWPLAGGAQTSVRVEQAAASFLAHLTSAVPDSRASSWRPPPGVGEDVAGFFRGLHAANRDAAELLAEGVSRFPSAGEDFLGFSLLTELGRGAFGRVFLAKQAALAGRLVAVKVAPDTGGESQALAQMQHTHVVPVYSVHRAGALQAVVMPFSGSLTLADVLRELQKRAGPPPADGADLAAMLRRRPRKPGVPRADAECPPQIAKRSYADAVLWLGGCLADGLAHAHQRGILHRDVKPANVLLTDDGTPMLLDFNVSEDVKQRGPGGAVLGGTLPYMAPEQLEAFVNNGPAALDGRCDVYSLGIVLYELLTGRFPFHVRAAAGDLSAGLAEMLADRRGPVPCPRDVNRQLSPAAAAIVRHCLQPDPARRYASAAQLHEDVERHLRDEPLRYAPNDSPRESLRKWVRRNPRLPLFASLAAVLLLAVLGGTLGFRHRAATRAEKARLERIAFRDDYRLAQLYLGTGREDVRNRRAGVTAARQALDRYGVPDNDEWSSHWRVTSLPANDRAATRAEAGELLLLLARASAQDDEPETGLQLNRRAEACFGDDVPGVLYAQRTWLRCRAGLPDEPSRETAPSTSARDRYLEAQELIANGETLAALRLLEPAAKQEPDHYWVNFLLGICFDSLGRDERAQTCYTVCIALMPDFHPAYLNRGLSYLRQRQYDKAKDDLDRAIAGEPERGETYFDRALARWGKGDAKGAIADLDEAQTRGMSATRTSLLRALWREKTDRAAAKRDLDSGLERQPVDERDYLARGEAWLRIGKAEVALKDFDKALEINPQSRAGWMNKANVLAEYLNRQPESAAALDRVLELYPDHAPALAGQAVVLARLGQRQRAHARIADALARDAGGLTRYQAGCVYALTSPKAARDAATALVYLREAIEMRFGLEFIDRDDDLAALKQLPAFVKLVAAVRELREALRRQ